MTLLVIIWWLKSLLIKVMLSLLKKTTSFIKQKNLFVYVFVFGQKMSGSWQVSTNLKHRKNYASRILSKVINQIFQKSHNITLSVLKTRLAWLNFKTLEFLKNMAGIVFSTLYICAYFPSSAINLVQNNHFSTLVFLEKLWI